MNFLPTFKVSFPLNGANILHVVFLEVPFISGEFSLLSVDGYRIPVG